MAGNGFQKTMSSDPLVQEFLHGVTLGRFPDAQRISVFGHDPAPAAGHDVWEGAPAAYPFQTVAAKMELLSASANDTAAGTGARSWMIVGLDANFNQVSEIIATNGVTPVQSVNSYLRVNGLVIQSAGSGNVNAGDTTLRVTGAGPVQALAKAGYGLAKQAIFTVPANYTYIVTDLNFSVGGSGTTTSCTFSFTRVGPGLLISTTNEYVISPLAPSERAVPMGGPVLSTVAVTTRVTGVVGTPAGAYSSISGYIIPNSYAI